jgi:glycosyltransferase involved in cell wall biosynthesis
MLIVLIGSRDFNHFNDGISIYVKNLVLNKYINGKNFNFILYVPEFRHVNGTSENLGNGKEESKFKIIPVWSASIGSLEKFTYSFSVLFHLLGTLRLTGKYVFHFHGMSSNWIIPFLRLFYPQSKIIFTQHSLEHINKAIVFPKRIFARITFLLGYLANKKIAVSCYVAKTMSNAKIIRNGGAFLNNTVLDKLYLNIQAITGIDKSEYLLFVGRLNYEKGIDYAIVSFIRSKLFETKKFIIVGDIANNKNGYKRLLKLFEQNGITDWPQKFYFTGRQDQNCILSLMRNAYLNVVPSFSEGFSLVTQECLNIGRYPLLSDIPAHKEFDLPNEFYFTHGSIDDLVSCFNCYSFSDSFMNGENSFRRTWDEVVIENYKIYECFDKYNQ